MCEIFDCLLSCSVQCNRMDTGEAMHGEQFLESILSFVFSDSYARRKGKGRVSKDILVSCPDVNLRNTALKLER